MVCNATVVCFATVCQIAGNERLVLHLQALWPGCTLHVGLGGKISWGPINGPTPEPDKSLQTCVNCATGFCIPNASLDWLSAMYTLLTLLPALGTKAKARSRIQPLTKREMAQGSQPPAFLDRDFSPSKQLRETSTTGDVVLTYRPHCRIKTQSASVASCTR